MEKNQIKLPKGFFDEEGEADEFRKTQHSRIMRLLKSEGLDQTFTNQKERAEIEDIKKTLENLESLNGKKKSTDEQRGENPLA